MKKIINSITALILSTIMIITGIGNVSAATDTIQLGKATKTSDYIAGVSFYHKITDKNEDLYCLNRYKNAATNIKANLVKNSKNITGGLVHILKNGYPNKTITGNKEKDYYITQTAVWWYLDETTGSSNLGHYFKKDGSDKYDMRKYVKQLVQEGVIGRPLIVKADFGIHPKYDPNSRLFDPSMGGGSVYDIGIYPLFMALYMFGVPQQIKALSVPAPTGVDMTTLMMLKHKNEMVSLLSSSFACNLKSDATIAGEKGTLRLDRMFHMPTKLFLQKENEENETEMPLCFEGNGYNYEAAEVMKCMDKGEIESTIYSHAMSKALADIISNVLTEINEHNN